VHLFRLYNCASSVACCSCALPAASRPATTPLLARVGHLYAHSSRGGRAGQLLINNCTHQNAPTVCWSSSWFQLNIARAANANHSCPVLYISHAAYQPSSVCLKVTVCRSLPACCAVGQPVPMPKK
jgi:hypothetical protein